MMASTRGLKHVGMIEQQ